MKGGTIKVRCGHCGATFWEQVATFFYNRKTGYMHLCLECDDKFLVYICDSSSESRPTCFPEPVVRR